MKRFIALLSPFLILESTAATWRELPHLDIDMVSTDPVFIDDQEGLPLGDVTVIMIPGIPNVPNVPTPVPTCGYPTRQPTKPPIPMPPTPVPTCGYPTRQPTKPPIPMPPTHEPTCGYPTRQPTKPPTPMPPPHIPPPTKIESVPPESFPDGRRLRG